MPISTRPSGAEQARAGGYAVPAMNMINDLTLEAVLAAAEEYEAVRSIQTSSQDGADGSAWKCSRACRTA